MEGDESHCVWQCGDSTGPPRLSAPQRAAAQSRRVVTLNSIIDANSYIMGYSKGAFGRMMSPNAQACVDSQAWLAFLKLTFEISCSGCNGSLVIGSN